MAGDWNLDGLVIGIVHCSEASSTLQVTMVWYPNHVQVLKGTKSINDLKFTQFTATPAPEILLLRKIKTTM